MSSVALECDVLYIAGSGHSGSTLLELLLAQIPGFVAMGEVHKINPPLKQICGCGTPLGDCEFWNTVQGVAFGQDRPNLTIIRNVISRTKYLKFGALALLGARSPLASLVPGSTMQGVREHRQRNGKLFNAVASVTGSPVVVDKSCNGLRLALLGHGEPRVKAIHLVRDGRAVAASSMRRLGLTSKAAALRWATENRNVELALRKLDTSNQIRLRYEDVCRDIEGTSAAIGQLLGKPGLKLSADFSSEAVHIIPGNPALLTGPGSIRLDERWRKELSRDDGLVIEGHAARYLSRYGYEPFYR